MNTLEKLLEYFLALSGDQASQLTVLGKIVVAVAVAVSLWFLLKVILRSLARKGEKYEFVHDNKIIIQFFHKALNIVLIFLTGAYIFKVVNIPILETIFQAAMILLLASPVTNVTIIVLTYLEKRIADKTENKVDDVVFDLLNKFAGVIIYILAVILALDLLGINVVPFIAGAGVLGVAVGFAAKDTLSNLIAGVLLIIDRPFEIGDRIEVWAAPTGSATWGDVIDIGIRATRIKTTDNIIIIIPNNEIMKRDIVNYTSINAMIRVRINIGIAYDADLAKAKQIVLDVAAATPWVFKGRPAKVVVQNFGESSVDLQLRIWIQEARRRMDTISHITDKVKEAFDEKGIEIPYPKRDITITERAVHK